MLLYVKLVILNNKHMDENDVTIGANVNDEEDEEENEDIGDELESDIPDENVDPTAAPTHREEEDGM